MTTRQKDTPVFSFDENTAIAHIETPAAFSYAETLLYLTRSPLECLHSVENGRIYKLLEAGKELLPVEISKPGPGRLQLRFMQGPPADPDAVREAAAYTAEWLDLARDMTPFYATAQSDPLLGPLASGYYGLRIIGVPHLFEALCWAIAGQQINLTFAYTLKRRLVENYGKKLVWEGRTYWLFPKPGELADVTVEELRQLQFTGKKAEYILHVAGLMDSGALSKEALLASGSYETAERTLLAIRGIGPWTAHYVLMRCLRNPAAFPIGDAGLHNALKQLLHRTQKPALEEIRQLFAPWRGWEAYAVFYLWRSLLSEGSPASQTADPPDART
ncbi:DNA-3-methyladenine glycosylase family protein [Paenibacillus chitinolyticus]|uniref:DNA-3-methyladenine glycosylase family protein n=1 Tax=Paenibacillus chitinolyticus TaxID=79263 RepID=UPI003656B02A